MSFSGDVKTELCAVPVLTQEDALAEASGITLFCNQYNAEHLRIITESSPFAERIPVLFQSAFGLTFDRTPQPGGEGRMVFEMRRKEKLASILNTCGCDPDQLISLHINFGLLETSENRRAFLRGAFLAGGSVTDPRKRYHLELSTSHSAVSRELLSVLEECGFRGKHLIRKGNYLIYFKQGSEIMRLLAFLGAEHAAGMVLQAIEAKGSVNKANRRSNCDLANVDKMVAASRMQVSTIAQLEAEGKLDDLPEKLREAAVLRREHPELSLTELGELCNPPVSKSSFNHRLKKLMQLASSGSRES